MTRAIEAWRKVLARAACSLLLLAAACAAPPLSAEDAASGRANTRDPAAWRAWRIEHADDYGGFGDTIGRDGPELEAPAAATPSANVPNAAAGRPAGWKWDLGVRTQVSMLDLKPGAPWADWNAIAGTAGSRVKSQPSLGYGLAAYGRRSPWIVGLTVSQTRYRFSDDVWVRYVYSNYMYGPSGTNRTFPNFERLDVGLSVGREWGAYGTVFGGYEYSEQEYFGGADGDTLQGPVIGIMRTWSLRAPWVLFASGTAYLSLPLLPAFEAQASKKRYGSVSYNSGNSSDEPAGELDKNDELWGARLAIGIGYGKDASPWLPTADLTFRLLDGKRYSESSFTLNLNLLYRF